MILRTDFQFVSEALIDAKFLMVKEAKLQKRGTIFDYSKRIVELVGELESGGQTISEIERKRVLL